MICDIYYNSTQMYIEFISNLKLEQISGLLF